VSLDTNKLQPSASEPAKILSSEPQIDASANSAQQQISTDKPSDSKASASVSVFVAVSATSQPGAGAKNAVNASAHTGASNAAHQGEETKSQTSGTVSVDPGASADEIEVQFKGEVLEYESLASLRSHSSHHVLFANERSLGTSRHELPESSVTHMDKTVNFVDTFN